MIRYRIEAMGSIFEVTNDIHSVNGAKPSNTIWHKRLCVTPENVLPKIVLSITREIAEVMIATAQK